MFGSFQVTTEKDVNRVSSACAGIDVATGLPAPSNQFGRLDIDLAGDTALVTQALIVLGNAFHEDAVINR